MQDAEVLEVYEAISTVTEEMLFAARQGDWDTLIERERACRTLVDWLRDYADGIQLPPASQARKVDIVRKVLADDAEIRNITQPRLAWLGSMLQSSRREREVHTVYTRGG